jgi:hypothetical protein
MSANPDGGPAFPVLQEFERYDDEAGRYRTSLHPAGGMSLRDALAEAK